MLLRNTLDYFLSFYSSHIFQRNSLDWKCWVNEKRRVTERAITVRGTCYPCLWRGGVKAACLCSRSSRGGQLFSSSITWHWCLLQWDQCQCHREHVPVQGTGSRWGLLAGFSLCSLLSFERSTRKLLSNPRGLFSSLLPPLCTMFSHSVQFQSTYFDAQRKI